MSLLDGQSEIPSPVLITENTPTSESSLASETKNPPHRHLGDHECRIFSFVSAEKPFFILSTKEGWCRYYVNTAHIKHCAADCAKHVAHTEP